MVEDEFAFELVEFDALAVEFGADIGLPVFGDRGEFFGDVDFLHGSPRATFSEFRFSWPVAGAEVMLLRTLSEKPFTTKGTKVHEGNPVAISLSFYDGRGGPFDCA